jgi:hypothetical protein
MLLYELATLGMAHIHIITITVSSSLSVGFIQLGTVFSTFFGAMI